LALPLGELSNEVRLRGFFPLCNHWLLKFQAALVDFFH